MENKYKNELDKLTHSMFKSGLDNLGDLVAEICHQNGWVNQQDILGNYTFEQLKIINITIAEHERVLL